MAGMFFSFRWRALGLAATVTVLTSLALYVTAMHVVADVLRKARQAEIERLSKVADTVYITWARAGDHLATIIASQSGIAAAVEQDDMAAISVALTGINTALDNAVALAVLAPDGRLLHSSGSPKPTRATRLAEMRAPHGGPTLLHTLQCDGTCIQHTIAPILHRGRHLGWVAIDYPITEFLLLFQKIAGASIELGTAGDTEQHTLGDTFKVRLFPHDIALPSNLALVATLDTAPEKAAHTHLRLSVLSVAAIAVFALLATFFIFLYSMSNRLRQLVRALPLLASGQNERFRASFPHRQHVLADEIDALASTLVKTSLDLDSHQQEQYSRAVEKARRELAEKNAADRAELVQRTSRAFEEQRRALARELHDELGQWLVALRMDVASLRAYIARSSLGQTQAHALLERVTILESNLDHSHQELRRLMANLRPELLDTLGLEKSLGTMVSEWKSRLPGCAFTLEVTGAVNLLDDPTQVAIYRVVQEALTNIAKHAAATAVEIRLSALPEGAQLTVTDNGSGFSPEAVSRGRGLGGMRDRAMSLGGTFELIARPGGGTVIDMFIPGCLPGIPPSHAGASSR
jgi:signal transduction histidine kinase